MIAPLNCLIMQLGLLPPIADIILENSFCYIKSARLTVLNILLHILNMRGLHMVINQICYMQSSSEKKIMASNFPFTCMSSIEELG